MVPLLAVLLGLSLTGQACPHEGSDHRLLGDIGCPIQKKLTIEDACPPRTIWSFHLFKVSVKIDPKHPHLLIEWPTRSQEILAVPDGLPLGCQRESLYFSRPLRSRALRGRCESTERTRNSVQVRFEGTDLMRVLGQTG
jgi:hypothetical protein